MIPIGAIVKSRRKWLGLGQADLATAMGLSQASISKLENGRLSPTVDQLLQFAKVLQMQPHDFFVNDPYRPSTDWFGIETLRQLRQLSSNEDYPEMLTIIRNVASAPFFKTARNRSELQYWKAWCFASGGQHEEAIQTCLQFVESNPNYPDTTLVIKYRIVLGTAYRNLQAYEGSRKQLEIAHGTLRDHPEIIDADLQRDLLYNLGCTYQACGQMEAAMEVCLRLRNLHAEGRQTWFTQTANTLAMMGDISMKQGHLEQALDYYTLAIRDYEAIANTPGIMLVMNSVKALNLHLGRLPDAQVPLRNLS